MDVYGDPRIVHSDGRQNHDKITTTPCFKPSKCGVNRSYRGEKGDQSMYSVFVGLMLLVEVHGFLELFELPTFSGFRGTLYIMH